MEQSAQLAHHEFRDVSQNGPLSAEELAAYLDGRLSGKELERVEAMLASSPDARAELVEVSRLVATIPERRTLANRRWILISALAAAAVVAIVMVPSLTRSPAAPQVATERRVIENDGSRIRVISPAEASPVSSRDLKFVWDGVPGSAYQFTLTDADGRVLWQRSTEDTTLVLPDSVKLAAERSYYWNVDALAANGSSVTTGVRELTVSAK